MIFSFLELNDVSIVVILLLLAHLNLPTLLRPDENGAFEYRIITPTPTLKYHQNLIPFSWTWTEWYRLISGIVFLFKTDKYLLVLATPTLVFFIPLANWKPSKMLLVLNKLCPASTKLEIQFFTTALSLWHYPFYNHHQRLFNFFVVG